MMVMLIPALKGGQKANITSVNTTVLLVPQQPGTKSLTYPSDTQLQMCTKRFSSHAFQGHSKGLYDLARKKPYVQGDTMERLDLLRCAGQFFNNGFVSRFGRLNKVKTERFEEEMDRVSRTLRSSPRSVVHGSFKGEQVEKRGYPGFESPPEGDGWSESTRVSR